jgi:hypothetical protein
MVAINPWQLALCLLVTGILAAVIVLALRKKR